MAAAFASLVTCDICFEVYISPQSLSCRHTFCLQCIDKIKKQSSIKCPMCGLESSLNDVKADFRSAALVETYNSEVLESPKTEEEKINNEEGFRICDLCFKKEQTVVSKCEKCDKFMCKECHQSHLADGSSEGHTVKSLSALAAEARSGLKKAQKELDEVEKSLLTQQKNVKARIGEAEATECEAVKEIREKEEKLIKDIRKHHDKLCVEVHQGKEAFQSQVKELEKTLAKKLFSVKVKKTTVSQLLEKDEQEMADFGDKIQELAMHDVQCNDRLSGDQAEGSVQFNVQVNDGQPYDVTTATRLKISHGVKCDKENIFTSLFNIEYKAVKTSRPTPTKESDSNLISKIEMWNDKICCLKNATIELFNKDLSLNTTISVEKVSEMSGIVALNEKYSVVACADTGLHIYKEYKFVQTIQKGNFVYVNLVEGKLYAYDWKTRTLNVISQKQTKWVLERTLRLKSNKGLNSKRDRLFMTTKYLYISSYDNHYINKYSLSGELVKTYGQKGEYVQWNAAGDLDGPLLCGVDSEGSMLVVDQWNCRVQVCTDSGQWVVLNIRNQCYHSKVFEWREPSAALILSSGDIVISHKNSSNRCSLMLCEPVILPQLL